mgnify:CR=1 FL=1
MKKMLTLALICCLVLSAAGCGGGGGPGAGRKYCHGIVGANHGGQRKNASSKWSDAKRIDRYGYLAQRYHPCRQRSF